MNQTESIYNDYAAYIRSLKGRSWADICYEEEEREEEEARLALKKKMDALKKETHATDQKHKQLYLEGKYELEDGEIFE
jgi:hypothetical protein